MALRTRLLLAFLVPTLVVLSGGGFVLYRVSRAVLENELGASLASLASTISAQLKADRVMLMTPDDAQGEGSRTWRSLTMQLGDARTSAGLRRVMVFDTERRARIDLGGGVPMMSEVPELLRDELELKRVWGGAPAASQVLFEGNDGRYYKTGYAPLVLDGKVVGAVAVEGSAEFFGPLTQLRNAFIGLAFVTLTLLFLAAVGSARALSRPLERLVAGALRIGTGDLSTPVDEEPTQEIGILSRELEQMRRALENRDRQLKLMLGGVAHEVRNPLGGIELFAGLLGEELERPQPNLTESKSHLERIRRELDYLKRIVEDFLAWAREQKLNLVAFEVEQLLKNAASHLEGEASGRGIALAVSAEPARLQGDENLLTGALVNLVKNAVQVSTQGQTVRLEGRVEGARYLIRVRDEGPGIAADLQSRIFEPFFTTRAQGTGLGLPLAVKLVEAHRGTLVLASRPRETVFTISLPLES